MKTPDVTATAVGSMYTAYPSFHGAFLEIETPILIGSSLLAAVALGFAVNKPSPLKTIFALAASGLAVALPISVSRTAARDISVETSVPMTPAASWETVNT